MSELILNKNNFEQEVLNSDKPVVVDFWAPWCGPCQMMGPVLETLDEESEGSFVVGKVNIDAEDELAERFRIMSIPTIKIFKNGNVVATSIGYTPESKIRELLKSE